MNNVDQPPTTSNVDLEHPEQAIKSTLDTVGRVASMRRCQAVWEASKADTGFDDARLSHELSRYFEKLPVFELFDVSVAAGLVGKTPYGLRRVLRDHADRFPPRYRKYHSGQRVRYSRVLTAREILEIRTATLHGPGRFTQ